MKNKQPKENLKEKEEFTEKMEVIKNEDINLQDILTGERNFYHTKDTFISELSSHLSKINQLKLTEEKYEFTDKVQKESTINKKELGKTAFLDRSARNCLINELASAEIKPMGINEGELEF
eukprot:CAMPEP_0170513672 /NCGR_PEP_ID=MMETSP0209-20121228/210_1 /TAXON_ID=665100 ORGANISM="Litonotus pictus, Strain P1" /NCGR_SAMPLE_ID=MMETSP0209 /ASSEMBLY_ACC=CAM_ASM_000301 /LENGTH=120 /DNA_ID=CAMNT_0010797451 /DNA_START=280 /DNA_END=642 /DNA_ORIENTATION=-